MQSAEELEIALHQLDLLDRDRVSLQRRRASLERAQIDRVLDVEPNVLRVRPRRAAGRGMLEMGKEGIHPSLQPRRLLIDPLVVLGDETDRRARDRAERSGEERQRKEKDSRSYAVRTNRRDAYRVGVACCDGGTGLM